MTTRAGSTAGPLPVAAPLLAWYRRHRRDLPWRGSRDPYRVWVSEIMLQQTQVERVKDHFTRFMERFPDVATLARAPERDVLRRWEGLWDFPRAAAGERRKAGDRLLGTVGYAVTHHRVTCRVVERRLPRPPAGGRHRKAVSLTALGRLALTAPGRRIARLLAGQRSR